MQSTLPANAAVCNGVRPRVSTALGSVVKNETSPCQNVSQTAMSLFDEKFAHICKGARGCKMQRCSPFLPKRGKWVIKYLRIHLLFGNALKTITHRINNSSIGKIFQQQRDHIRVALLTGVEQWGEPLIVLLVDLFAYNHGETFDVET